MSENSLNNHSKTDIRSAAIYLISTIIIGWVIGCMIWQSINIPLTNPYQIISPLTQLGFNPTTNLIRFTVFVIIPSAIFLICLLFPELRQKLIVEVKPTEFQKALNAEDNPKYKNLNLYKLGFIFLFILITFISLTQIDLASGWPVSLDIFHDGEQLTAANNYLIKNELWSGTNFIHGAFYDVFATLWTWQLLGVKTIGAFKLSTFVLTSLSVVLLSFLILTISTFFKNKIMSLAAMGIVFFIYIISDEYQFIDRRDIFALIGLCILLLGINYKKYSWPLFFIAGLFSAITFFCTIDRGSYYTATILVIMCALPIFEQNRRSAIIKSSFLFLGLVTGWIIFYLVFGPKEWASFLSNTFMFLKVKDYFDSYIYLSPNIFTHFIHALPLMITSINLLVFCFLFFSVYIKQTDKRIFFLHLTILTLSIFYFRSGLGRSDVSHLQYGSTFIFLCLGLTISIIISMTQIKAATLYTASKFILVASLLWLIYTKIPFVDADKTLQFIPRTKAYVQLENNNFYNQYTAMGIARLKDIYKDEPCYFAFTNEPGMGYLLDKPTCGDSYNPWFNSPLPWRRKLIGDLQSYKPKYIIYGRTDGSDDTYLQMGNRQRLPEVNNYILSSYELYEVVENYWIVLTLKE